MGLHTARCEPTRPGAATPDILRVSRRQHQIHAVPLVASTTSLL